jgi:NAD(P)-dependent dehydrogenase (short-subunit alcohol dehydrogenase family)
MSKTIVFITGANTGIGYEAVKALFQSQTPYHVLLGSRSPSKADDAIAQLKKEVPSSSSTVEPIQIDITDDDSINKAFETIKGKFGKVDVLVNNAGAAFDLIFDKDLLVAREIFNKANDVNVSGTQVITAAFVPLLLESSSPRLIFLTSGLSTLQGASEGLMPPGRLNITKGWPKENLVINIGYRASKAALNMVMLSWHGLLKIDGVKVWAISPGFLATGLAGVGVEKLKTWGAGDASLGGDIIKSVIEGERDADVGKVVGQNGVVQAW